MFRQKTLVLFVALAFIAAFAGSVFAVNVPLGAQTIDYIQSQTGDTGLYPPATVNAEAGNLTQLWIHGVSQTKSWQGFYGNVSGTIILENSVGYRFYDWAAANPQGEVYASVNNSITWTTIACAPTLTDSAFLYQWQDFYGINYTDYDSINTTYNMTNHPVFDTGYTQLSGCPTTYTYVNNASQFADFPAVLLTSDTQSTLIFTSILENKTRGARSYITGYDGNQYDFQLLVSENGQLGQHGVTPYYFWVELQ